MTTSGHQGIEAGRDNLDHPFFDKLQNTLDTIGLSTDEGVIVGGQVYAAYGLRPADDLDILVGPQTYSELVKGERESTALAVNELKYSQRPGVMSLSWIDNSTDTLHHADVICRYDPSTKIPIDDAQEAFTRTITEISTSHSGLHFATLENNIRHMLEYPHLNKAKAKRNTTTIITSLHQFLDGNRISSSPIPLDTKTAENALHLLEHKWRHKFAHTILHR